MRLTPSRRSVRRFGSACAGAAFLAMAVTPPSASALFFGMSGGSHPTVDACQNPNTVGAGMAW